MKPIFELKKHGHVNILKIISQFTSFQLICLLFDFFIENDNELGFQTISSKTYTYHFSHMFKYLYMSLLPSFDLLITFNLNINY